MQEKYQTPQVAIVTDSLACLTRELAEQYGIEIIPIYFYVGDNVYKDWVNITPSEAYGLFLQDPGSFKTSAAPPEECLQAYRKALQRAPNILCVTVSTKLSTVFNVAQIAKEQARKEHPEVTIEVLDSRTATACQGLVALAAARAAALGKDLTEVVRAAHDMMEKANCLILLDTIRHVYRSGRIPKVASRIGSALNIRPIFTISAGAVRLISAVRNRQQGINRIIQKMRHKVGQSPVHVAVMHAYAPNEAEQLKQRIATEFNCTELWLTEFSPLMGYACGTGTLGLAFCRED